MKALLAVSLAIVLIIVFAYINFAPAFKLDSGGLFNFSKQPPASSAPTATSALPTGSSRSVIYSPAIPASSSTMPFRGPTSPPHVNGPTSPPPTSSPL
ncbi:hypothetical protein M1513_01315 [Patescibacteria group bacterium]|nr:hypothetical protein [Patescibacteria group bacterium]MCL5733059.1 hypothetical protein [Patescibacteria group bacterium]